MAIAIEAYTVVVRNEAIVHRYPGGAEAFMMNVPNQTFCADSSLARISFTSGEEADDFLEELESLGMRISDGHDAVLCDAAELKISPSCPWLCLGTYKDAAIAWITGENVRTVIGPKDWDPEKASREPVVEDEETRARKEEREVLSMLSLFQQAGRVITHHIRQPAAPVDASAAIDVQRAIEQLEIVTSSSYQTWTVYYLLGKAWHAIANYEKACASLAHAWSLEKSESIIPCELAMAQIEAGRFDQAIQTAETAAGEDPLDPDILGTLATAYLMSGRLTAAEKALRAALKHKPDHSDNLSLLSALTDIQEGKRPQPTDLATLLLPTV